MLLVARFMSGASEPQGIRVRMVSLCMVAIPLLTLLDILTAWRWPLWLMALACLGFIALERRHASAGIRRTSLVLIVITISLLPLVNRPLANLARGVQIGGLIASLLMTVNLLSRAALRVRLVQDVMSGLFRVHGRHRYASLSVASQFFGGLLGLAGITMMMEMASQAEQTTQDEKIATFAAISRGYAAVSLWSPMYSNISILLALYQGPDWTTVLPLAVSISIATLALGTLLDAWMRKHHQGSEARCAQAQQLPQLTLMALPLIVCMLGFLAFVIGVSRHTGMPVSAIIIITTPIAAWYLNVRFSAGQGRAVRGTRLLMDDYGSFKSMVGEVMLFVVSGCAGTVIANAIPMVWTSSVGAALTPFPFLSSMFLTASIVLLSCTAVHPLLSSILIASSFPPHLLGLPVIAHLCSVLVGWGLAIIVTPFSVISLMASRYSGIHILTISLRSNMGFVALSILFSSLILGGMRGY